MFNLYKTVIGAGVVVLIGCVGLTYGFRLMSAPSDLSVIGGFLLIVSDVFLAAYLIGKILQGGVRKQ